MTGYQRTSTPGPDDLALLAVKGYLRVDGSDQDDVLSDMLSASRAWADGQLKLPGTETVFSERRRDVVSVVPASLTVSAVGSLPTLPILTYRDAGNTLQTFSDWSIEYYPAGGYSIFTATAPVPVITESEDTRLGWTVVPPDDTTALVRTARLIAIGGWYESRDNEGPVPQRATDLLGHVMELAL